MANVTSTTKFEVGKKYKPLGIVNTIIEILFSDHKTIVFNYVGLYHGGERVSCSPTDDRIYGWTWREYREPVKQWYVKTKEDWGTKSFYDIKGPYFTKVAAEENVQYVQSGYGVLEVTFE